MLRLRVDQRRDLAVADHAEVEGALGFGRALRGHSVPSVVAESAEQPSTRTWPGPAAARGRDRGRRRRSTARRGTRPRETVEVGDVVADEHRPAARERRLAQELPDRVALGEQLRLHFDHHVARLQRETRRQRLDHAVRERAHRGRRLGRATVVQRQRLALVLEHQARIVGDELDEPVAHRFQRVASARAARCSTPQASRRSKPWMPATGNRSGASRRSRSSMGRPLTSASAPPSAAARAREQAGQRAVHGDRGGRLGAGRAACRRSRGTGRSCRAARGSAGSPRPGDWRYRSSIGRSRWRTSDGAGSPVLYGRLVCEPS